MSREALEEAGITIEPADINFAHVMHRQSDKEYLDFFFTATKWEGEPMNTEPDKCDDMQWFPLDALPENTLPYVKEVIANLDSAKHYSETGW